VCWMDAGVLNYGQIRGNFLLRLVRAQPPPRPHPPAEGLMEHEQKGRGVRIAASAITRLVFGGKRASRTLGGWGRGRLHSTFLCLTLSRCPFSAFFLSLFLPSSLSFFLSVLGWWTELQSGLRRAV